MENGFHVVLNGSREYLPTARQLYPGLVAVLIEADPDIIRKRLESRGRENKAEIEKRLLRKPDVQYSTADLLHIRNDGLLKEGGDALIDAIAAFP
jgi:ribose 1,5-bisphosphokinase